MERILKYDVIIVGCGPAGLFAAYNINHNSNLRVAVIDKGESITKRLKDCTARKGGICKQHSTCHVVHGGGGTGLFSDGKLCLSLDVGGHLDEYFNRQYLDHLTTNIKNIFQKYDGYFDKRVNIDKVRVRKFENYINKSGLEFKYYPTLHIGSDYNINIISELIDDLKKRGVDFFFETEVKEIMIDHDLTKNLIIQKGSFKRRFSSKYLVLAPGKAGSTWLLKQADNLNIPCDNNRSFFGIRVETNRDILEQLFEVTLDPKIYRYYSDGSKMKTHCMCRGGEILMTMYGGLPLAGGHSFSTPSEKTGKTNFGLLLSISPDNMLDWNKSKAILKTLKKLTAGKLVIQTLGDFRKGVKTTREKLNENKISPTNSNIVYPGNILDIPLPDKNFKKKVLTFLDQLNKIVPGISDDSTLLYGLSIEWWGKKVETVDSFMQTRIPGLYVAGDGAGWSQGIVHAAATGLLSGKGILRDIKIKKDESKEEIIEYEYVNQFRCKA